VALLQTLSFNQEDPYLSPLKHFKSIALTLLFQEFANAFSSQEDPYYLPCKDLKLMAFSVQELGFWIEEVPNPDVACTAQEYAAAAVAHWLSKVLITECFI
jgi:hypothetical protein